MNDEPFDGGRAVGEAVGGASGGTEAVLEVVAAAIRRVIGEQWADEIPIGMETSFSEDLELESIEFVALAEELQQHFGQGLDFVGWLSSMELDQIIGLTVGQLVELILDVVGRR